MKWKIGFLIVLAVCFPLVMIACGGGGGGGGGDDGISLADMAGTWFGTYEGPDVCTIQVTIDSSGNMTDWEEDSIDMAWTGTLVQEDDQVFSFSVTTGGGEFIGGLLVDPSGTYAAYLDDDDFVGILQKGATALPGDFDDSDFVGSWDGYSVWVNSDLDIVNEGSTEMTVYPAPGALPVIGTSLSGAFAGTLEGWVAGATYGVAGGQDVEEGIFFEVFLSVDKQAAASYACPFMYVDFITDCEFGGWVRAVD